MFARNFKQIIFYDNVIKAYVLIKKPFYMLYFVT